MGNALEVFTTEITNATITLQASDGITKISIFNNTAVAGTVTGTKKAFERNSEAINVAEDETLTIIATDGNYLKDITIVAPASCTLKVVAI